MLSKKQFDILTALEAAKGPLSQRALAAAAKVSLGIVNKMIPELSDAGLIEGGKLTEAGLAALEPYRVKRAVFLAAGFGTRLVPITLNTPKPLVRVKGKRIIDSLLDAVYAAGIEEVYLVRGYLAEQFDQLLYKYPNIKFIENPMYLEANNISSAYVAREYLASAYIFEADLLLYNPALITKYQYQSNYIGVPVKRTDDWCLKTKNGVVTKLQVGGTDCYHLFGITYWTQEDGSRLARHLEEVFLHAPGGKERFWDQVALDYYLPEYKIGVRPCTFDDLCEIDTFGELQAIDETYKVK